MARMKIAILSLLAVIATALVIIAGYIGYKAHRENRLQAYSDCFRNWNVNPDNKSLKEACGDEP
jgi:hypothetical protein